MPVHVQRGRPIPDGGRRMQQSRCWNTLAPHGGFHWSMCHVDFFFCHSHDHRCGTPLLPRQAGHLEILFV